PPQLQTHHLQHYSGLSGSTLTNGLSPQSVPLPATPLSAALGPAAQATVPSTPASAYSDRFFAGDVFQRADSLLSMQSAMPLFYRFISSFRCIALELWVVDLVRVCGLVGIVGDIFFFFLSC